MVNGWLSLITRGSELDRSFPCCLLVFHFALPPQDHVLVCVIIKRISQPPAPACVTVSLGALAEKQAAKNAWCVYGALPGVRVRGIS